jgi:hypothetical protein
VVFSSTIMPQMGSFSLSIDFAYGTRFIEPFSACAVVKEVCGFMFQGSFHS